MKLNEIVRVEPEIKVTLTTLDIKIIHDILGNRTQLSLRGADYNYDQEFKLFQQISEIKRQL